MRTDNLKDNDMRVTLNEQEVNEAITNWLRGQVPDDGRTFSFDYTAGRGANGLTATIEITRPTPRKLVVGPNTTNPMAEATTQQITLDQQAQNAVAPVVAEQDDEVVESVISVEEAHVSTGESPASTRNPFAGSQGDEDQGEGSDDDSDSSNEADEVIDEGDTEVEAERDEEPAVMTTQPATPVVQETPPAPATPRKSLFQFASSK